METAVHQTNLPQKEQKAVYDRIWREKNRERIAIQCKKYRDTHKEEVRARNEQRHLYCNLTEEETERQREYKRKFYEANREKALIARKKWAHDHPERTKEKNRKWREDNRAKAGELYKTWYKMNLDKVKSYFHEYRARKRNVTVEKFLVKEIFERDGWTCQLCKQKVDKKLKWPNPLSKSLDHIMPLSLGGPHSRANVHLAHLKCNMEAHTGGIKQTRLF